MRKQGDGYVIRSEESMTLMTPYRFPQHGSKSFAYASDDALPLVTFLLANKKRTTHSSGRKCFSVSPHYSVSIVFDTEGNVWYNGKNTLYFMKEQSMYEETTIAAIATAPGEGGIGIIRLSGVSASEIADKIFHTGKIKTFKEAVPRMMYFGHVTDGEKRIDEGLAVYMKAPRSYTGEDVVEIQIHGSAEALRETLSLALRSGAVPAMRGEFTKRAFLNGRLDLAQAEAVMDIISAKGEAALTQAESHLSGALSGFVHEVMEELKDLITKLEVTIDYPEEDLEDLTMEETGDALEKIDKSLSALLKRSEEGRVIREGLRTAIIGRPNAGKSSLLNALLQEERAIVTDVPGTTRDTIEEAVHISGVSLLLMDTAGLRETDNKVEQIGIERARASMEKADLILAVIDGSSPLDEEDKTILHGLGGKKAIVILNKYDLTPEVKAEDIWKIAGHVPVVSLSARYGSGMDELRDELRKITEKQDADAGRVLFLTNLRHVELVRKALDNVLRARASVREGLQADFIVIDLTEAWKTMGEITGDTMDDELIHSIFSRFCVGK
ncbi:tRNA uridine-5-carboxymethylaminomethyl(34) synthesis GTPase MnmE [Dialister invisus]|uniref:tRNA uridine-5-carboxymethylaminomethyl(34) synthesis GTPase MnmE n=1 Tax=Dialister invisus TaxID=218538 RepID=UPI0023F79256|nr:tRNA uridine-5-carboxymethylaminomethyl(34) synthesis GTPase MnmE [Dialister invisus]